MSRPTSREEQMRAVYQAFLERDFDAIVEHLHPDAEYVNPGDAVEPGTRSGAEEFIVALRRLHEFFDFEAIEVSEFVERGDQAAVVVRFVTHGKESAIRLELDFGHLLTWKDGKICRLEWFRTPKEAIRALDVAA
jgi:ketosteroid isomerase-like protein